MAVELRGYTEYNDRFPPNNAKKGYVARINGRVSGAATFDREFLGNDVLVDDAGLYERQMGLKKGGSAQYYHVIVEVDGELIKSINIGREMAMTIAKRMDGGESLADMVELSGRPSKQDERLTVYDCTLKSKADAKKAVQSATIDSAIEHCWSALTLLPEAEAKKVLAALKMRVSPPKPKASADESPTPEADAQSDQAGS